MEGARIRDEKTVFEPITSDCVILDQPHVSTRSVPGAMPGPQKPPNECSLIQTIDGAFSVNVFKTRTVVSYGYFDLERGKTKYNSSEKVEDGTRVRTQEGDQALDEDLEGQGHRDQRVNKSAVNGPSVVWSASEMSGGLSGDVKCQV